MPELATNVLYYGDNLDANCDESGRTSDAQFFACEDTWHWGARQ